MPRTVLDTLYLLLGGALSAASGLVLIWVFDLMEVSR
jgi:hypothetical protein